MELKKGNYLVSGEIEFTLRSPSRVYCIGKKLAQNESVHIPEGKRIPIELETDAEIEFILSTPTSADQQIEFLPERSIPTHWDTIVNRVVQEKLKTVIVLGEVDTGKTFFSTYLANRLIEENKTVAVLDLDAGQSDIGPPGTLGLATLSKLEVFLTDLKPTAIYYLGSHSPALHFIPYIVGFCRLTKKALSSSEVLIVDTPGWVCGDGGRAIHRAEIELLQPDLIVLLQRADELEHLVKNYNQEKVVRLTVSKKASVTSPEERKKLREELSQKYFTDSIEFELPFEQVSTDRVYLLTGSSIAQQDLPVGVLYLEKLHGFEGVLCVSSEKLTQTDISKLKESFKVNKIRNLVEGSETGIEVALCDENSDVISLAIIKKILWMQKKFVLLAPITPDDIAKVKIVQFGSLRLTSDGKENGFVEPGFF